MSHTPEMRSQSSPISLIFPVRGISTGPGKPTRHLTVSWSSSQMSRSELNSSGLIRVTTIVRPQLLTRLIVFLCHNFALSAGMAHMMCWASKTRARSSIITPPSRGKPGVSRGSWAHSMAFVFSATGRCWMVCATTTGCPDEMASNWFMVRSSSGLGVRVKTRTHSPGPAASTARFMSRNATSASSQSKACVSIFPSHWMPLSRSVISARA